MFLLGFSIFAQGNDLLSLLNYGLEIVFPTQKQIKHLVIIVTRQ